MSFLLSTALVIPPAFAQSPDPQAQARFILERLTGVRWSPDSAVARETLTLVQQGRTLEAARLASGQPQFLNVVIRQMAAEMSTREESIRTPLNDFVAGVIGVTRDERDARELLTGDFYYMGDPNRLTGQNVPSNLAQDILSSNNHYNSIYAKGLNIGDVLMRVEGQRLIIDDANATAANPDAAGVLTSRAFLEAHASAGTNRRLVEYTFREFMCSPINDWADAAASDLRIGRDIDRFPGGDHKVFQTSCKACHTGMDGFRGAFARWDFANNIAIHSMAGGTQKARPAADGTNKVMTKMNKNGTVFPSGYVTTDDSWVNNAIRPGNASLFGWRVPAGATSELTGNGVKGLGALVANSKRFSTCLAQRAFKTVCKKDLTPEQLAAFSFRLGQQFEQSGYKIRSLFEKVVTDPQCGK